MYCKKGMRGLFTLNPRCINSFFIIPLTVIQLKSYLALIHIAINDYVAMSKLIHILSMMHDYLPQTCFAK